MKSTVKFYANGEVVKTETFKTKKEAQQAIKSYERNFTVSQKVKNQIQSHIF